MTIELSDLWRQTLSEIQKRLSKPSFETWLKATKPVSLKDSTIVIEVPNEFTKDWLETRYKSLILTILKNLTDTNFHLSFVTSSKVEIENEESHPVYSLSETQKESISTHTVYNPAQSLLNPRYTFESFVVGICNRLAHAASLAVAEAPARAYNPLFIYGGVGLGKTHLLHAIGQFIYKNHGNSKVYYFSSEKFTNDFINAIRDNKTVEFRNKYRNMDVLLIDDIQFLAGKEQTQEEFFHTFNTLHENNRQIVISSDRPPKEIPTLEDRLRSRFEWGLITDIQPPDLETRIAILKKKALSKQLDIPYEVILYIANKITTNIRELEGALTRILAYASLSQSPVTLELTNEALKDFLFQNKKPVSVQDIINATALYYGLSPEDLLSKKRTQQVALTRQIAMFLSRELTDLSLPKIGEKFGGKDHTTVIHAYNKISDSLKSNSVLKHDLELIKNDLLNS